MRRLTLLSFLIVLASCSEVTEPAAPEIADPPAPAFNFGNNPDGGGMLIYRGQWAGEWWSFWIWDVKEGLQAWIGRDIAAYCADPSGYDDWDLFTYQEVWQLVRQDNSRILQLLHGEEFTTSVWPLFGWDCDRWMTDTPLATGTSKFRFNDNDLFGVATGGANANSWGARFHGALTDASGEKAQFSAHYRCTKPGPDKPLRCNHNISLQ